MNRVMLIVLCWPFALVLSVSVLASESDVEPAHTLIVDNDAWAHSNWASFDQDKMVSHGNFQYTIYWDADKVLVVVRRDLRNNKVQALRLTQHQLTINPEDGHRNTVLGVSPGDGRLHLSWDHHGNDLRYTKTRKGFLTDPPEQMSKDDFEPAQPLAAGAPQQVTYPRFMNDASERLYFIYRSGGSGNGKTVISRYDDKEGKWDVSAGVLFGSKGKYQPWQNSTSRNAYLHDVLFDQNDRLHITWIYRETARTWASNHDLHYAYSDDAGRTWMNNNAEVIADLSKNDPITIDDPGIVVQQIPVYSWVMNQCAMAIDASNQPHVALYKLPGTFKPEKLRHGAPPEVSKNLRFFHYWRDTDGNWNSSGPLEMPDLPRLARPNIVIDQNDTVIIYWSSPDGYRAFVATASDQWKNWRTLTLTGPAFSSNDASKHDRRLLSKKGILSFAADPQSNTTGQGYAILDFNIKDLIAAAQDGSNDK